MEKSPHVAPQTFEDVFIGKITQKKPISFTKILTIAREVKVTVEGDRKKSVLWSELIGDVARAVTEKCNTNDAQIFFDVIKVEDVGALPYQSRLALHILQKELKQSGTATSLKKLNFLERFNIQISELFSGIWRNFVDLPKMVKRDVKADPEYVELEKFVHEMFKEEKAQSFFAVLTKLKVSVNEVLGICRTIGSCEMIAPGILQQYADKISQQNIYQNKASFLKGLADAARSVKEPVLANLVIDVRKNILKYRERDIQADQHLRLIITLEDVDRTMTLLQRVMEAEGDDKFFTQLCDAAIEAEIIKIKEKIRSMCPDAAKKELHELNQIYSSANTQEKLDELLAWARSHNVDKG